MLLPPDAQAVLDFWFGPPESAVYGRRRDEWFRKDPRFDALIAQNFGTTIESALSGGLAHWAAHPASALARIVVLDQFPRNCFRDSARAFAGDTLARDAAQALVAANADTGLLPVQRSFVYLPFEHAEDLALQDEAVRLFTHLAANAPELTDMLDYAHRHREVIRRFGRFPHRNAALGRTSTALELSFLEQPGARF